MDNGEGQGQPGGEQPAPAPQPDPAPAPAPAPAPEDDIVVKLAPDAPAEAVPVSQETEALPVDEAPALEADSGNGGTADSSADGGTLAVGDVNSGDNTGNVIEVA